jgi:hypothetical protein
MPENDAVEQTLTGVTKFIALNKFAQDVQKVILNWRDDTEAEANGKERDPEKAPFDDPHFKGMFFVQSAFLDLMQAINPTIPPIAFRDDGDRPNG